jgi:hypothetical protein
MNLIDLSRRLSPRALRRLVNRYRRQLVGGASLAAAAAFSVMLSVPALANDVKTPLAPCNGTATLTTPCAAPVTPTPAAGVSSYTVVLPGIGTLSVTIDPTTNLVTAASMSSVDPAFTASAVKIDEDTDKVTVTLTSAADPSVVYKVTVKVKPPETAGGAPTITAKVKTPHKEGKELEEHHSEGNEAAEHAAPTLGFAIGDHD